MSLIEVMVVMVILGALSAMAMAPLARNKQANAVKSARMQVSAKGLLARSTAVRLRKPATLRLSDETLVIAQKNPDGTTTVSGAVLRPRATFDVSMTRRGCTGGSCGSSLDSVVYNSRGIARLFSGSTVLDSARIVVSGTQRADSVCITGYGQFMTCGQ